jgi:peptidoglycan/xylan/chitin deacetylase (PgdA/CDA1 family)
MRRSIIKIILFIGIHNIFRFIYQRNRITVILYHDIDAVSFENQIKYLVKKYTVIDLNILYKILIDKSLKIPKNALMITFDDGHIGNYKLLGIIKKYEIKPVIFLTSNIIGTQSRFWFNLPFRNIAEMEMLMSIPDKERRNYLDKEFEEIKNPLCPQALTIEMIQEMIQYVDFQSHTVDHPCLPNCSIEDAYDQIVQSKTMIETITGKSVIAIAYPNGDFQEREIKLSKDANYTFGFAATQGFINLKSNNYCLHRLSTDDTCDYNEFLLRVTGVWMTIKKLCYE